MNKNELLTKLESESNRLNNKSTQSLFEFAKPNLDEDDIELDTNIKNDIPSYELDLVEPDSKIPGILSRKHVDVGTKDATMKTINKAKPNKSNKNKPKNPQTITTPSLTYIQPDKYGYTGIIYDPESLSTLKVKREQGEDMTSLHKFNSDDRKVLKRLANKSLRSPEEFSGWKMVKPKSVWVGVDTLKSDNPTDTVYIMTNDAINDATEIPIKFFNAFYEVDNDSLINRNNMKLVKATPKNPNGNDELYFVTERLSNGYRTIVVTEGEDHILLKVPSTLLKFYENH